MSGGCDELEDLRLYCPLRKPENPQPGVSSLPFVQWAMRKGTHVKRLDIPPDPYLLGALSLEEYGIRLPKLESLHFNSPTDMLTLNFLAEAIR